uniref:ITPR-interacting domain-containing protein n=1 Tax=Lepeophtheirus salmonis TaxID=72036 RepID=A0A0K2U6G1_LEPSM
MGTEDAELTSIVHSLKTAQKNVSLNYPNGRENNSSGNLLHPGVDNSRQRRKSPVTVQEWVAALPIPHTVQRGLALETQQQKERKNKKTLCSLNDYEEEDDEEEGDDDEINDILKGGSDLLIHSNSQKAINSSNSNPSKNEHFNENSDTEDDNLILGAEAALSNQDFHSCNKGELSQKRKCRNSLDTRRRYLKESRDLYRSFQSDISIKTVSSVDSVLLARELNPTEMLMELGFGGPPTSMLARVPRRFLQDSEVKGISLRKFISMQDEVFEYNGNMDNNSHANLDDHGSFNIKSKSEIVDSFLEHLINPSTRQSWVMSSWPSSCSLSRIPSSYTTNSIISSSQSSSYSVMKPTSLKGVQAFRAAAHSVLSPANRQFLSEKPKPTKTKKLILGDETLTVSEDGDIENTSENIKPRRLSVESVESDWSGDDEELQEMKRVAASSAEKNKAILRWKRIRKAAVEKKKEHEEAASKEKEQARLIFPVQEETSSISTESEDENDEKCFTCSIA